MRNSEYETPRYQGLDARSELARLLKDPASTGAVISGPIGSAKTALLESVLGDQIHDSIRLLCSPVLGEGSFGALSPLLVDFEENPNEVSVLRYLSHELSLTASGSKPFIVVEEAHYMDAASAFVLTQLVQAGRIRLILLAVGSGRVEPVVASTEIGARLGRVALGPLSLQEVVEYSQKQLEGRVTSATAAFISKACAGNPLLIQAFLRAARNQEILIESGGWFVLSHARAENDVHLSGVVSGIQKRLEATDAKALEILALGGAEESDVLEQVSGTDIGRLLGTGLVTYTDESSIEIKAPIYAQVLRDIVPPGRSIHLWKEISAQRRTRGTLPTSLLWACESGEAITNEEILEGAILANENLDFHSAWRLCLHAGNRVCDAHVALQGARALMGMQRYQTVVSTVEQVSSEVTDLRLLGDLNALATAALWRGGGSRNEIHGLLQNWKVATEILQTQGILSRNQEPDRNRQFMQISEMWIDLVERRGLETLPARAQECQESCKRGSLEYLMCCDLRGKALMSLGFFVEASDTVMEAFASISDGAVDEFAVAYQILGTGMQALFAVGDYAKIRSLNEHHVPGSAEVFLAYSGMLNFWAAFASIQEGRWNTATELLEEARAELAVHDPEKLLVLADALSEFSSSQLGRNVSAELAAIPVESFGRSLERLENRHAVLLASAYQHVSRNSGDFDFLGKLVEQAHGEELFETEQQLLMLLWRCSSGGAQYKDLFKRLAALCADGVGRKSSVVSDAVLLDETAEPSTIRAVAEALHLGGETGLGAEMLVWAMKRMNGPQDERQRGILLRRLSGWVKELGGTAWGPLSEALNERVLTSREKEIIALVGRGLGNKEIARALTVSQRTVEGHLYRVFTKLGISGREELGDQS